MFDNPHMLYSDCTYTQFHNITAAEMFVNFGYTHASMQQHYSQICFLFPLDWLFGGREEDTGHL